MQEIQRFVLLRGRERAQAETKAYEYADEGLALVSIISTTLHHRKAASDGSVPLGAHHRSRCSGRLKSTAMAGRHTVSKPVVIEEQKAAPDKLKMMVHVCNRGSAE